MSNEDDHPDSKQTPDGSSPEPSEQVDRSTDETMRFDQEDSVEDVGGEISVRAGKGHLTVKEGPSDATVNERGPSDGATVVMPDSIMTGENLSATVNPRDLSDEDLDFWNTLVGKGEDAPTSLPPAIDRTFSDKHFDRLRKCEVGDVKTDPEKAADYELLGRLGQGGMGDVFVARQGSLDRLLALKLIKPLKGKKRAQLQHSGKLESIEEERRQQFLSEAIVTGDLDHPNIVPIHDVALTSNNELFYSMKRVDGTPWSKVIDEKTRDENLEILLKAADAIGFAHTRGVVHRDIKPENIMLGPFGVVMVMDWGLALPTSVYEKHESIFSTSGLGGTPAFMAPELATGPLAEIGPASDIYLLGATLYMIITGMAPHEAKNVTECLRAVRANAIRPVSAEHQGELMDIALKAMASNPDDRYPDVASFQQAIRDYRSRAESISLATWAADDLRRGRENRSYGDLSRAAFRFEEAIKFWEGNEKAHQGLAETKQAHAAAALENGDFDLGLSLLDEQVAEHQSLIEQLREALRERESRQSRLSLMRKVAAAMLVFILVGGSIAMAVINHERNEAEDARDFANRARDNEETAKNAALESAESEKAAKIDAINAAERAAAAKQEAVDALVREEVAKQEALQSAAAEKQAKDAALMAAQQEKTAKLEAERARDDARTAQTEAERARRRAEYEEYVSKIGLAKARLERNEADGAREILDALRNAPEFRDRVKSWEWRWLWRQATQSESAQHAQAAVVDLAVAGSGLRAAVALSDGTLEFLTIDEDGRLTQSRPLPEHSLMGYRATTVAFSPDQQVVAVGTESGTILLFSSDEAQPAVIELHGDRVNDLQFNPDGLLVSGSSDKTVRIWDPNQRTELTQDTACFHISPVRQIAVAGSGPSMKIAVAISDDVTGQVAIWDARQRGRQVSLQRRGTMTAHQYAVTSVAMSADGQRVASGDIAGNVLLWNPDDVAPIDYDDAIREAITRLGGQASVPESGIDGAAKIQVNKLVDANPQSKRLVSTRLSATPEPRAHEDVVKAIRFSGDGKLVLTSSDDYTLKIWDVQSLRMSKTLKGHGGWVVGGEFLRGEKDVIVSASNDESVRSWRPAQYVGASVLHRFDPPGADLPAPAQTAQPGRQKQAHQDEIWSASFSRDGRRVVTASHDHTARVMEIDPTSLAFREVSQLEDEVLEEGTSFVAMSMQIDRPRGRLFIGTADATIRIWDLRRGTQIGEVGGTGLNTSFAVSGDGRLLLTGSSSPDFKALLWEIDPSGSPSPRILHRLGEHAQAVTAFAISPDSSRLFTGDRDGFGILWNAETGHPIAAPVQNVRGFRINAASFTANGNQLAIAADDEQLTLIDIASRQTVAQLNHVGFVTQLALSADGRHAVTVSELASGSQSQTVATLWDLRARQSRLLDQVIHQSRPNEARRRTLGQRITSARFDAAGNTVVVSRSAGRERPASASLFDVPSIAARMRDQVLVRAADGTDDSSARERLEPEQTYVLPAVLGTAEAVLPIDRGTLLTMNKNGAFRWNLATQRLTKSYRAHAELTEACFSSDGRFVATASRSVKIWDVETGKVLAKLESPRPVRTVQFAAPIGKHEFVFATGGDDGIARLWAWNPEAKETNLLQELPEAEAQKDLRTIRKLRFSPKAEQLLVVGDRGLARVWNLNQPGTVMDLPSSSGDLTSGAFSADGTCVAVAGVDKQARIWVLPQGVGQLGEPAILDGHADTINDIVFLGATQDELRVMTASADDTARVWDPRLKETGQDEERKLAREILSLRRHSGDVTSVDVTDDGTLLMTAGRDGAVILWPADPPPANLFDAL